MYRIRETLREMRQVFVLVVGLASAAFLIFYLACLAFGRCHLTYDSHIVELGICLQNDAYAPVTSVPFLTKQLFLCGEIEGTTPRPGAIYLYFNGHVRYIQRFEQKPGLFFQPLPVMTDLRPGEHKIEVYYARRLLASVEFKVVNGS